MATASPCALLDMGKCGAPCIGAQSVDSYFTITSTANQYLSIDSREVIDQHERKMNELALAERFEEAAEVRNRLSAFIRGTSRAQRIRALTRVPEIITALKITDNAKWEFVSIRYGRLAGSALSKAGINLSHTIESLKLTSEVVLPKDQILPASSHEEVELLLNYLDSPGLRLVEVVGEWQLPIFGSGRARANLADVRKSYEADNRWLTATQFDSN